MASMVAPSTRAPRRVVRGRDTEFPGAPIHVSDIAQTKSTNHRTLEQFDISERDRRSMSQRPSTSGPATPNFSSKRRVASERGSRDDFYYNPKSTRSGKKHKSEVPLPSPTLSTPKSVPTKTRKGSFSPFPSVSPSAAKMNTEPTYIGMALGSPTHQPSSYSSPNTGNWTSSPDSVIIVEQWPTPDAHLRRKQSKWKTLGGLLGARRHTEYVPTAFYQLQPEPTQNTSQTYTSTIEAAHDPFPEKPPEVPEKPSKPAKAKRSTSLKKVEKKPSLKRAQTAPQVVDMVESSDETPQVMTERGPPDFDEDERFDVQTPIVSPVAPQLDVDIPSIKLDRYSVMFSGLLGKPNRNSSALLARRQANLEKLKTVNEAIQDEKVCLP